MPQLRLLLSCFFISLTNLLYAQSNPCPPNIDFETGGLSGWNCFTGICCPINTPTFSGPVATRHTVMSGTGVDPYGGFPLVPPGGGNFSFRLGNDKIGAEAERVRYYMKIPASTTQKVLMVFKYAVVLEDPNHSAADQPRFTVNAYDSATSDPIPCVQFNFVASSILPGFQISPKSSPGDTIRYKPWSSVSVNLSSMVGKTVALDFATGDCALGGHFGYAYIDLDCGAYSVQSLLCSNGSSTIKLIGPPGFQTYKWYDSTFSIYYGSGQNLLIAKPSTNSKFAVALTPYPGYGCPDTLFTSTALSDVSIHPTKDTSICAGGETITLKAGASGTSAPFTYNWTPATGLSCTNCANPLATVNNTTTYHIAITDSNGCPRYDSVTVTVKRPLGVKVKLPFDTVCQYGQVKIFNDATASPNDSDTYYSWTLDSGIVNSGQNTDTIMASWLYTGIRKVKIKLRHDPCTASDSAYIYVKPSPLSSFSIQPEICLGDIVKLVPREEVGATYHWKLDDYDISDTDYVNPEYVYWFTLGKKNIQLTMNSPNGCSSTFDTSVRIHEYPSAAITASATNLCKGDTVTLHATEGAHYFYEWAPRAFLLQDNLPTITTVVNDDIKVWVKVTTQWGCSKSDTTLITTENCCNIYFPDAFTPNGDGTNDKFRIITNGNHTIHTFKVMNRWGHVIYEGKDITNGWDGTYKGIPQDPGTYYYYVNYICNNGKQLEKAGNFILVR
jgi:gliding motility-associated-like protein